MRYNDIEKEIAELEKLVLKVPDEIVNLKTEGSLVGDFYKRKSVFITGASGFLGKILVEKLLRACTGIDTIYVMIREKKGKNLQTRLDEIYGNVIFGPLSEMQPDFRKKIVGIHGDASLPGLGISPTDRQMIKENVSIIFHAAATVRFDEKIKVAIHINVRGTKEILALAHECQKLQSFVHISTAYSNCVSKEIDEIFYKPPYDTDGILAIVDKIPEQTVDQIAPILQGEFPNSYALSKIIAEQTVQQYGQGLPICVFRPSIVISTYREPLVGWTDNVYGPAGVTVTAGVGLLRTLHCDGNKAADMVPVDYTVNAMIVASYKNHIQENMENMPIYNYVSAVENRITWDTFQQLTSRATKYPCSRSIWCVDLTLNKNLFIHWLYVLFLHWTTGVLLDTVAVICGKKAQLIKGYKKLHKFGNVISYFCTQEWNFTNNNTQKLWEQTSDVDRKLFAFCIKEIDWKSYFIKPYPVGLRLHILKDPFNGLPAARTKYRRLLILHNTIKYLLIFFVLKWAYGFSKLNSV